MPQVTDWIAQSYQTNSMPMNASRVVNMFAERQLQDAKSKAPVGIWMHPGTSPFATVGRGPVVNFDIMGGKVYAVTADSLYRIEHNGVSTYLGKTSVSSNGCGIANNGTTICWCDGVTGWTYNITNGVKQITDPFWYPASTVTYYDTYFVFDRKGTQQFFLAPPQWNGTTPIVNPMDTTGASFLVEQAASKEASSDLVVACVNSHQQLFVFGEKRIEVWYDAGNAPPAFPFQRSFGALIHRGLMAPYSVVLEDNTVFFLGDDLMYWRLNGFQPERVSDHAIESKWQQYRGHFFTRAISYTVMGHKMIALTFPQARATWVLDLSTKRWHERESWTADNNDSSIGRWRVNCALNNSSSIERYPEILLGDSLSGRVDQLNNNVFREFDSTMRALIVGPPIHADRRRVFMRKFEIDVESGAGAPYTQQVLAEFCPGAITMTTPTQIETVGALEKLPATYSNFVFSNWVRIPDDAAIRGMKFGNNNVTIVIANDASSSNQIKVQLRDSGHSPILDAEYRWAVWNNWVWVGISVDTTANLVQCWVSTLGYGDVQLSPAVLTWSSTHAIGNDGSSWSLAPGV